MVEQPDRRSFFAWGIFALGAVFSAILGIPSVCYLIDPRHRKGEHSNFKLVDGIDLDDLPLDKARQGVIRDTRRDGWTLYPNDVVGRVWVVMKGRHPANLSTESEIRAFNENQNAKNAYLLVFTTICPHLGCSINLNNAGTGYQCPCHGAAFAVDGQREGGHSNPAARDMDTLAWKLDEANPKRIVVQYQNFLPSLGEKKPIA